MAFARGAGRLLAVPQSRTLVASPPVRKFAGLPPNLLSDLRGKVIVCAGAGNPPEEGHGIGALTAITLARQGAKVVSVSNVALNCETVNKAIEEEGGIGMAITADCTKLEECEKLCKTVVDTYGKVDVMINAGIHTALPMGFGKMTPDKWQLNMDLNLNAHFNLIFAFLPTFQAQQSGNIMHFTTFGSHVALGMGNQRHGYFAGKGAAAILTKRIGIENATQGIRANVVSIGYTTGPLVNRAVAKVGASLDDVTAARDANVPRQKQITPEEIANVAAFLASDMSSGINATEVFADGGNNSATYGP